MGSNHRSDRRSDGRSDDSGSDGGRGLDSGGGGASRALQAGGGDGDALLLVLSVIPLPAQVAQPASEPEPDAWRTAAAGYESNRIE